MLAILSKMEYEEMSYALTELRRLRKQLEECVTNPGDVIHNNAPVDFSIERVTNLLHDVITDC